jgi:hypothetical protein
MTKSVPGQVPALPGPVPDLLEQVLRSWPSPAEPGLVTLSQAYSPRASRDWVGGAETGPSEQGLGQGEQGLGQGEQGLDQGEQELGQGEQELGQGEQGLGQEEQGLGQGE